jgi:hypothetical protein
MESITAVKLLSCFDDLVAAGTASGRVAVFQLVSSLPGRNKQVRTCCVSISSLLGKFFMDKSEKPSSA